MHRVVYDEIKIPHCAKQQIDYLIEKEVIELIDFNLNAGMDDITCLRIVDIISQAKKGVLPGLNRKMAKLLWVISGKQKAERIV